MEPIGSIYTEVSDNFQKGIIGGGIFRCVKAEKHDLGVVMADVKIIGQMDNSIDHTFEQWRDYLKESTESKEFVIMNEYDDLISFDYLMELIEEKQKLNAPDMFEYCENINGYRFASGEFS